MYVFLWQLIGMYLPIVMWFPINYTTFLTDNI